MAIQHIPGSTEGAFYTNVCFYGVEQALEPPKSGDVRVINDHVMVQQDPDTGLLLAWTRGFSPDGVLDGAALNENPVVRGETGADVRRAAWFLLDRLTARSRSPGPVARLVTREVTLPREDGTGTTWDATTEIVIAKTKTPEQPLAFAYRELCEVDETKAVAVLEEPAYNHPKSLEQSVIETQRDMATRARRLRSLLDRAFAPHIAAGTLR